MESDAKPRRKKLQRRRPTTVRGPETGPAEPGGSAGPVSPWYREELILEQDYRVGPLPSPAELRLYGEVDPKAPAIIFREFEQESEHRRGIEWAIVTGESRRADRGQLFALMVLLSGLLIGGFLVFTGHDVAGSVIAGADLVAGAALFIREARGGTPEPEASR